MHRNLAAMEADLALRAASSRPVMQGDVSSVFSGFLADSRGST
jgi:hypothetical protein